MTIVWTLPFFCSFHSGHPKTPHPVCPLTHPLPIAVPRLTAWRWGASLAPADQFWEEVMSIRWVLTLVTPTLLPSTPTSGHGCEVPPSLNGQTLQQETWENNHRQSPWLEGQTQG